LQQDNTLENCGMIWMDDGWSDTLLQVPSQKKEESREKGQNSYNNQA